MGALSANRQPLTMAQAAIAGQIHQTLDVHRCGAAQITFNGVLRIDRFADLQHFLIAQILHAAGMIDPDLVRNLLGLVGPDTMNIGQRDDHALISRDINPGNTSHLLLHAPQARTGIRPISTL